jgi:hypothetical protein
MMAICRLRGCSSVRHSQDIRKLLTEKNHITSLVRPEYHAFFDSAYVPICAFTVQHSKAPDKQGVFIDLNDFVGADVQSKYFLEAIRDKSVAWRHQGSSTDFHKVPGSPIAYWLSSRALSVFEINDPLSTFAEPRQGLITGDNDRFLRQWFETEKDRACFGASSRSEAKNSKKRWFPHHKGGSFRKWFGNHEFVVDWENDGVRIRNFFDDNGKLRSRPQNLEYYFRPAATWTSLTVGSFNARICRGGFVYDAKGPMAKPIEDKDLGLLTALLNSSSSNFFLKLLAPTMDYNQGPVGRLPWAKITAGHRTAIENNTSSLVQYAQSDWDAYETSWDFTTLPLLSPDHRAGTLEATYARLRTHWQGMTDEMQRLEEENNRIFIDAYGLQDELTPEVPIEEITLTCNPAYRYGVKGTEEERETRLRADTMAEFLSYAVGCMFGRYSLDAPGLILANQGETLADYLSRVPEPSFLPDEDNVIPVLDADWFADDIVDRFRKFLRVTFGEAHFRENLAFIEAQIGDIRKYFTRAFYDDHVKRYKKRPIYWMFSSPKGTFQALIYMHRYRPDTVSVLLNDYLREFIRKLEAERARLEKLSDDPAATQTQRTKALKDVVVIAKQLAELEEWEREVIFPLAQAKIEIDLDDGVKRNYPLFGAALKPIKGLEAADE